MNLKSETVFDKLGNCLMKVRLEDDGFVEEKILPLEKYLAVLGDCTLLKSNEKVHVGRVPSGYYDARVSADAPDTFNAVLVYKEQKRAMAYGGKHWVVPFPALAFLFKVRKGILESGYAYALATDEPEDQTELFRYPFGNVSRDGKICFGNIKFPKLEKLSDADIVSDEFFMGETNGDYFTGKNAVAYNQAEMLSRLKKEEHFPLEWLTKQDSGSAVTLGQLVAEK